MNFPDHFESLLQKYFNGETTPSENLRIKEFVKRGQAEKEFFKEQARLHKYSVDAFGLSGNGPESQASPRTALWHRAAAAVALVAMLSYFMLRGRQAESSNYLAFSVDGNYQERVNPDKDQVVKNQFGEEVAKIERGVVYISDSKSSDMLNLKLAAGKTLKIVLQDRTEISLNSASDISFSDSFSDKAERVVSLNGEAFFSVAKNSAKPFYVRTRLFTTRVLGTKFNINSYSGDRQSSVYLVEGSIAVKDDFGIREVILRPGEGLSIGKAEHSLQHIQEEKAPKELAWLNNEIIFDNEPLGEIFKKIERKYGVNISNECPPISDSRFSGSFKDEPVDDIMETIRAAVGCKYTIDGKNIVVTHGQD